jgi:hypothetical protein
MLTNYAVPTMALSLRPKITPHSRSSAPGDKQPALLPSTEVGRKDERNAFDIVVKFSIT